MISLLEADVGAQVNLAPVWTCLRYSLQQHFCQLCERLSLLLADTAARESSSYSPSVSNAAIETLYLLRLLDFAFDFLPFRRLLPISEKNAAAVASEPLSAAGPLTPSTSCFFTAQEFEFDVADEKGGIDTHSSGLQFPLLLQQVIDLIYHFSAWRRFDWQVVALQFALKLIDRLEVNRSSIVLSSSFMERLVSRFHLIAPMPPSVMLSSELPHPIQDSDLSGGQSSVSAKPREEGDALQALSLSTTMLNTLLSVQLADELELVNSSEVTAPSELQPISDDYLPAAGIEEVVPLNRLDTPSDERFNVHSPTGEF